MHTYDDDALTVSVVAEAFGVNNKTVTRWADQGKIKAFKTPGGHRRFRKSEVDRLLKELGDE